jgi:ribonuclease PH
MRIDRRANDEFRSINFVIDYLDYADACVLIEMGKTKVVCNVTFQPGVPKFLKGTDTGWLTAEYAMLPTATHDRTQRDVNKGSANGRAIEIQRLIGRTLRNCIALEKLGENTLTIDCDVLQADGGTRTASINACSVALYLAIQRLEAKKKIPPQVFKHFVGAISCGYVQGDLLLDLNYEEDSHAQSDCNIIMSDSGEFLEMQTSAEDKPLSKDGLLNIIRLSETACAEIIKKQKMALGLIKA